MISNRWPPFCRQRLLSAIQNDSDLPQGLKATIAGTVAREGGWHLDAAFGEQGSRDQVAANPGLIWQRGDVP